MEMLLEGKIKFDREFYVRFNILYREVRGEIPVEEVDKDGFTPYQNFLYKRALYGLDVYTSEEKREMFYGKRKRILKTQKRCEHVLNMWKQELLISYTNQIFKHFNSSRIAKYLVETSINHQTDEEFVVKINLLKIGISKKQVIDKLIKERILPFDFMQLKKQIRI